MGSPSHDLEHLVKQATAKLAAEYERMRQLARDDPGTSGDQGEENWAELIRQWLPARYHVVTKGKVISSSGETSGQVDVLVLSPSYPNGLLSSKLYLGAGVLAAFECKRTLRRQNIRAAVKAGIRINSLARSDPRVRHQIIYGLLAHSHDLSRVKNPPEKVLEDALNQADMDEVTDPRDSIDIICVPPLGTWTLMRRALDLSKDKGVLITSYMGGPLKEFAGGTDAIGRFLTALLRWLGRIDKSIAPIADYLEGVGLFGVGSGEVREWPIDAMSDGLVNALSSGEYDSF
jgi:hypothetical protein